jgi:pilus assembly protein Flp/PilA
MRNRAGNLPRCRAYFPDYFAPFWTFDLLNWKQTVGTLSDRRLMLRRQRSNFTEGRSRIVINRGHVVARANINREEVMRSIFAKLVMDESAATAIEYGLIAAGISIAIITVVASLGSSLNTTFTSVQTALK